MYGFLWAANKFRATVDRHRRVSRAWQLSCSAKKHSTICHRINTFISNLFSRARDSNKMKVHAATCMHAADDGDLKTSRKMSKKEFKIKILLLYDIANDSVCTLIMWYRIHKSHIVKYSWNARPEKERISYSWRSVAVARFWFHCERWAPNARICLPLLIAQKDYTSCVWKMVSLS